MEGGSSEDCTVRLLICVTICQVLVLHFGVLTVFTPLGHCFAHMRLCKLESSRFGHRSPAKNYTEQMPLIEFSILR